MVEVSHRAQQTLLVEKPRSCPWPRSRERSRQPLDPATSRGATSKAGTSSHGERQGATPRGRTLGTFPQPPPSIPAPRCSRLGVCPYPPHTTPPPELLGSAHRAWPSFQTSHGGTEGAQPFQAGSELGCC